MYSMQINDLQLKKGHEIEIQDKVRGGEGRRGEERRGEERGRGRGGKNEGNKRVVA